MWMFLDAIESVSLSEVHVVVASNTCYLFKNLCWITFTSYHLCGEWRAEHILNSNRMSLHSICRVVRPPTSLYPFNLTDWDGQHHLQYARGMSLTYIAVANRAISFSRRLHRCRRQKLSSSTSGYKLLMIVAAKRTYKTQSELQFILANSGSAKVMIIFVDKSIHFNEMCDINYPITSLICAIMCQSQSFNWIKLHSLLLHHVSKLLN